MIRSLVCLDQARLPRTNKRASDAEVVDKEVEGAGSTVNPLARRHVVSYIVAVVVE